MKSDGSLRKAGEALQPGTFSQVWRARPWLPEEMALLGSKSMDDIVKLCPLFNNHSALTLCLLWAQISPSLLSWIWLGDMGLKHTRQSCMIAEKMWDVQGHYDGTSNLGSLPFTSSALLQHSTKRTWPIKNIQGICYMSGTLLGTLLFHEILTTSLRENCYCLSFTHAGESSRFGIWTQVLPCQ